MKTLKIVVIGILLLYLILNLAGCLTFRMNERERSKFFAKADPEVRFGYSENKEIGLFYAETINDSSDTYLLFIHGSPGSGSNFYEFLRSPSLTSKAQIASVDRPGFGHSQFGKAEPLLSVQADRISELLIKHRHQKILLCGHSLGAPVAIKTALKYPDLVQGLFILAGSVAPELEPKEPWRKPMDYPLLSWLMPRSFRVSNREIIPLKKQLTEMSGEWGNLQCKVYVLQGEKDKLVHPDNAAFVSSKLPVNQRTIVRLKNENHFIPFSEPELLITHLLNFMNQYGESEKEK